MKSAVWLIIEGKKRYGKRLIGQVRAFKKKPGTRSNELAIRVELDIPESYFETPELRATVSLPDNANKTEICATVERGVADALTKQMGMKIRLTADLGPDEEHA